MWIPRFTLARLLLVIAALAPVFFLLSLAGNSRPLAASVAVALVSLVLAFGVYAGAFLLLWLYTRAEDVWRARRRRRIEQPIRP